MSKFSKFIGGLFTKDRKAQFTKLIISAVTLFLGNVGKDVHRLVEKWVKQAEQSTLTGPQKFQYAYDGIKKDLQGISVPEYLVRMLIEACVATISEK